MRERPIPFTAPMVRAILAGTKTQTRRFMKPQPLGGAPTLLQHLLAHGHLRWATDEPDEEMVWRCPYGQPGDRLWVREAWRADAGYDAMPPRDIPAGSPTFMEASRANWQGGPHDGTPGKLRPGMFMPRWASRITLEVTGVRVERLQDISEADARAEGAVQNLAGGIASEVDDKYRRGFGALWESINGPGSWDANPWVWVVEFRRLNG